MTKSTKFFLLFFDFFLKVFLKLFLKKIHFLKKLPKDSSGKTNKYKLIVKPKELKGSFISAVFSLVSSNFGVGTLGLVYAIVQSGFAVGMLELFFFALMGILVCKIAADAAVKVRKFTFQEVLLVVLGRWAAIFYQITYSLGGFGACITYFIVVCCFLFFIKFF